MYRRYAKNKTNEAEKGKKNKTKKKLHRLQSWMLILSGFSVFVKKSVNAGLTLIPVIQRTLKTHVNPEDFSQIYKYEWYVARTANCSSDT